MVGSVRRRNQRKHGSLKYKQTRNMHFESFGRFKYILVWRNIRLMNVSRIKNKKINENKTNQ